MPFAKRIVPLLQLCKGYWTATGPRRKRTGATRPGKLDKHTRTSGTRPVEPDHKHNSNFVPLHGGRPATALMFDSEIFNNAEENVSLRKCRWQNNCLSWRTLHRCESLPNNASRAAHAAVAPNPRRLVRFQNATALQVCGLLNGEKTECGAARQVNSAMDGSRSCKVVLKVRILDETKVTSFQMQEALGSRLSACS